MRKILFTSVCTNIALAIFLCVGTFGETKYKEPVLAEIESSKPVGIYLDMVADLFHKERFLLAE